MKDRLKQLRKLLGVNQAKFGEKIGLSQRAISEIEVGTNGLTERNFEIICRTWNVNPNWLRYGTGEVFIEQKESRLQELVREFELEPDEAALVESLLELPPEYRAGVVEYVKSAAAKFEAALIDKPTRKRDEELTREEMHAMLDAELDAQEAAAKRATATSSASTGSSGSVLKFGKSP